MQVNWSLVLNVLLLIGVIVAIGRLVKNQKRSLNPEYCQPSLDRNPIQGLGDDIIAVRQINTDSACDSNMKIESDLPALDRRNVHSAQPRLVPEEQEFVTLRGESKPMPKMGKEEALKIDTSVTIMMFLLAKENRQFAGYELLQTVLASGLRFGEGRIFHRHQFTNGQGPVLCSLAAATATGVFDLQNMGTFSVHGLCLYMHPSKNPGIDIERFAVMLETAKQLSEGLDAHLLDDQRKPLTEDRIARYQQLLVTH